MSDIATALTNSIAKDGQTTPSADLPMGGYKHTGVAVAAARDQYATAGQVQDGTFLVLGSVSGADTITATAPISMSAYATGQSFEFVAAGTNTGAVTLNLNSIGAKAVTKEGTTALVAGNIPSGSVAKVVYDGTQFQLLNPKNPNASQAEMEAGTESALRDMSPLRVAQAIASLGGATQIQGISAAVGSNALTIGAGTLSLDFRDATLTSGTVTRVTGDPADLVVSSGSALGTTSAVKSRLAVLALNNAGTIELAVKNVSGGGDLSEEGVISTTAEGGAGAADSATVVYSTTARTNVAYRLIGFIESTQTTAGTWATAPSLIQGAGGQASIPTFGAVYASTTIASGTTYRNLTSKYKVLIVSVVTSGTDSYIATDVAVGGVSFPTRLFRSIAAGYTDQFTLIIPPYQTYVITSTPELGSVTISAVELA